MKNKNSFFDVIIVGGGLAGLCNAIHLAKLTKKVLLIEKNEYPKHKVCGEYISNEVLPYLQYLEINPFDFGAVAIDEFQLSTTKNQLISSKLPLGGFGISRHILDHNLAKKAIEKGVVIIQDTAVKINFQQDKFSLETKENNVYTSKVCIGAFGKRSNLDVAMQRKFIQKKSPYLAVKTHVKINFQNNLVALHNFKGGYCGVSKVEKDTVNVCYITSFESFKKHKNVQVFQENVVFNNHFLKEIFANATPLFNEPLTISQISFERKKPVENHIIMSGDAAGMIHPLCGNGMSMAIQSAQLAAPKIVDFLDKKITRNQLEKRYITDWNYHFKWRLQSGHFLAKLFRNDAWATIILQILKRVPFLIPKIIKQTHGKPISI